MGRAAFADTVRGNEWGRVEFLVAVCPLAFIQTGMGQAGVLRSPWLGAWGENLTRESPGDPSHHAQEWGWGSGCCSIPVRPIPAAKGAKSMGCGWVGVCVCRGWWETPDIQKLEQPQAAVTLATVSQDLNVIIPQT